MKVAIANRGAAARKRVLIVDDHPLMREGIAQWIRRRPELEVCGQAESASAALPLIQRLKPDLLLTDIALPGRNGIEFIKDVRALHPVLPVLVLSMHDESLYAGRALRAGARGYLMKEVGGDRVVQGILEVLQGRIVVSAEVATHLLEEYSGRRSRPGRSPLPHLTEREFDVFQLLGEARSNREIADQLHISTKTVESHRLNLMRKFKLKAVSQLMRFAIQYVEKEACGHWQG